jgi:hypothetical protein
MSSLLGLLVVYSYSMAAMVPSRIGTKHPSVSCFKRGRGQWSDGAQNEGKSPSDSHFEGGRGVVVDGGFGVNRGEFIDKYI